MFIIKKLKLLVIRQRQHLCVFSDDVSQSVLVIAASCWLITSLKKSLVSFLS